MTIAFLNIFLHYPTKNEHDQSYIVVHDMSDEVSRLSATIIFAYFNPLHAKFSRGNINICLYFMSSLHIDMTHVVEILAHIRQGPIHCA